MASLLTRALVRSARTTSILSCSVRANSGVPRKDTGGVPHYGGDPMNPHKGKVGKAAQCFCFYVISKHPNVLKVKISTLNSLQRDKLLDAQS